MTCLDRLQFRPARSSDAGAIAALHADSWRRHYRGVYADAFLDGDVTTDRLVVWAERLREPDHGSATIVVEHAGGLVGFAHSAFDDDPRWGALLDNLHVANGYKRRGVGTRLLGLSAQTVIDHRRDSGVYLWVMEQNTAARAFYGALGGACVERALAEAPGGVAGRLNGAPTKLRIAWPDPSVLVSGRVSPTPEPT